MNENLETTLSNMQLRLAETLLRKIEDGTATPTEMNVARQLLKDNNITGTSQNNPALGSLKLFAGLHKDLPTFTEEAVA